MATRTHFETMPLASSTLYSETHLNQSMIRADTGCNFQSLRQRKTYRLNTRRSSQKHESMWSTVEGTESSTRERSFDVRSNTTILTHTARYLALPFCLSRRRAQQIHTHQVSKMSPFDRGCTFRNHKDVMDIQELWTKLFRGPFPPNT